MGIIIPNYLKITEMEITAVQNRYLCSNSLVKLSLGSPRAEGKTDKHFGTAELTILMPKQDQISFFCWMGRNQQQQGSFWIQDTEGSSGKRPSAWVPNTAFPNWLQHMLQNHRIIISLCIVQSHEVCMLMEQLGERLRHSEVRRI